MATNQTFIDRSLQELGYLGKGEAADATDAADALDELNGMMHELKERSMDFNWFTQDTLGDTVPIPKWAESGLISMFAVRCGSVFNITPGPSLIEKERVARRTIAARMLNDQLDNTDMSHLPFGDGRHERYDIETDSY